MSDIISWILFLANFALGYWMGRTTANGKDPLEEIKDATKKAMDTTPVGAVKRPDAKTLRKWADPKRAAEEEAMIESLGQIEELQPKPNETKR